MRDYDDIVYQETVPLEQWLMVLLSAVLLAMASTLGWNILNGVSKNDRLGLPVGALATIVVAFAFWNYHEIQIKVTHRSVEVRYGLLNRTVIPISEIESCEPTRANFGRYLGIGVRHGLDGSTAYTTSFGPAVEIYRRSRRPFVVSTNRSLELCQVINGVLTSRS